MVGFYLGSDARPPMPFLRVNLWDARRSSCFVHIERNRVFHFKNWRWSLPFVLLHSAESIGADLNIGWVEKNYYIAWWDNRVSKSIQRVVHSIDILQIKNLSKSLKTIFKERHPLKKKSKQQKIVKIKCKQNVIFLKLKLWASQTLQAKSECNLGFCSIQWSFRDIAVLCGFRIWKSDSSPLSDSNAALDEAGGQPSWVRLPLPCY